MREGKNREVKNVLGHLGLAVNRLIRVSFGPFQLGDLAEGAVTEVRTRHLREQLGERIAAVAGADFSGLITARDPAQEPVAIRRPQARAIGDREAGRTRPAASERGRHPSRPALRPARDDAEGPRSKKRSPKRHASDVERLGEPELARREKRRRLRRKRS
jgi:23S rRNA pseudouridine2605 synthase